MLPRHADDFLPFLRPAADAAELQVVGAVPDHLVALLPFATAARTVVLHPSARDHIVAQRSLGAEDAAFCLAHLPLVVLRPTFYACERYTPGRACRVNLVSHVRGSDRHLLVGVKFVAGGHSESGADEWWVSTAHPLGDASWRRYLKKGGWAPVANPGP